MRFQQFLGAGAALWLVGAGAALAQNDAVYFSPQLSPQLTAPSYFEGLYTGLMTGIVSAQHGNFFTAGAPMRFETSGVAGWGTELSPGVIASGEIQASVNTDFTQATDFDVMALGRLGFLSNSRFMTYMIAGAGYFADAGAYELGLGYEWMASNNLSLRLEGVGIGQLGNVPNGNNWPGFSAVRLTSGAIWHFNGRNDTTPLIADPAGLTDFNGFYAGLYAGAWSNPKYNFFVDYGRGGHESRVAFGAIGGWNYPISDSLRVGVEAQGGPDFDSSGDVGIDGLALGHFGVVATPGLMPYLAGGFGVLEKKPVYAVGGGLEYALWGNNTLRGEVLAVGDLDGSSAVTGISAAKITFGTLWHLK